IAALVKHCKVLVVDLRGHGQTDKPNMPYNISLFTEDLARLLDKLKLTNLHVVGHSMGGMIAFQLALDHSALVKTLTIINSAPLVAFPNLRTRFNFWTRTLSVKWFGMKKLSVSLANSVFPKPEQAPFREKFIERWNENDSQAYLNSLHAFRDWNVMSRLGALKCPTLIITGDRDYTPVAYKKFYMQFIKDVHLIVIEDSGHLTIIDQAQKCNQAIIDFILKHEGTK
ncbi:MAG: alpha/beta fold hydrolase, partial [Candidatus Berkiella sp.]